MPTSLLHRFMAEMKHLHTFGSNEQAKSGSGASYWADLFQEIVSSLLDLAANPLL